MAKPPAKKRPYDAMRDESSRAIDAMPYTEAKPKPKPAPKATPKPAPKAAPKRSADWYMRNETAMPGKFKKGGKVKMAAGGKVYSGTFAEAFRAARKDGVSNFKWSGKQGTTFTTETAVEKAAREKKAAAPTPAKTSAPAPAKESSTPATMYRQMRAESAAGQRKQREEATAATRAREAKEFHRPQQPNQAEGALGRALAAARNRPKPASQTAYKNMMAASAAGQQKQAEADAAARAEEARKRAQATRNAVSGRPGQAKAKGGKIKAKKRYV